MRAIPRFTAPLLAALLPALAAQAADMLRYTLEDGTVRTVQVVSVQQDKEKEFRARILLKGHKRTLTIPSRRVLLLRRGDPDAVNQWSKKLNKGKQLLAAGRLATKEKVPGAEETFLRVAYTTERGTPGQEKSERVAAWQNMYAVYYLIETRMKMGLAGDSGRLKQALATVEEFKRRSQGKYGRLIEWQVPAQEGTRKAKVYAWGTSRLLPRVLFYEARILAARKERDKALAAYDALIERVKKNDLSPYLLAEAMMAKASLLAEGLPSDKQEEVFRKAGTTLSSLARSQPDDFGKQVVGHAANQALLRGADLLLESAGKKTVSYDVPLRRYQALEAGAGARDPALWIGAQSGIGICLVEKGQGEQAYGALIEVVVRGGAYPRIMARALYYLGRAAKIFADEIDASGGKGAFLRTEAGRWWADLKTRYPSSIWARRAQGS